MELRPRLVYLENDSITEEIKPAEMTDISGTEETSSEVLNQLVSVTVTVSEAQTGEGKCQTGTFPLSDGANADIHLCRLHLHTLTCQLSELLQLRYTFAALTEEQKNKKLH